MRHVSVPQYYDSLKERIRSGNGAKSRLEFRTFPLYFSARILSVQRANPAAFALFKRSFLPRTASGALPFAMRMISVTSNPRNFSASAKSVAAFSNSWHVWVALTCYDYGFLSRFRREPNPASINEYILSSISLNCPVKSQKYIGDPNTTASASAISLSTFETSSSSLALIMALAVTASLAARILHLVEVIFCYLIACLLGAIQYGLNQCIDITVLSRTSYDSYCFHFYSLSIYIVRPVSFEDFGYL